MTADGAFLVLLGLETCLGTPDVECASGDGGVLPVGGKGGGEAGAEPGADAVVGGGLGAAPNTSQLEAGGILAKCCPDGLMPVDYLCLVLHKRLWGSL